MGGLMGGGGGQPTSTTTTTASPPTAQLFPQGAAGYAQGEEYLKGVLANPPVYGGAQVAPVSPLSLEAIGQTGTELGATTAPTAGAEQNLVDTLSGNYLLGPGAQEAVSSLASPIFQDFSQNVVPGIATRAQMAGQGIDSGRRDVATENAINTLGNSLATGVVAPVYNAERANMMTATGQSGIPQANEITRLAALQAGGTSQQSLGQQIITAAEQAFQAPVYAQQGAAEGLISAAGGGVGGGSSTSQTQQSGGSNTLGTIATVGTIVSAAAKVAGAALCWVAEALYGRDTPRCRYARLWITVGWQGWAADATRALYRSYGRRVARAPWLCFLLRPLFDIAVRRGRRYAVQVGY